MATSSNRQVIVEFIEDYDARYVLDATINTDSPGSLTVHTLAAGANTITVPTGGFTVTAATIIPPVDNANAITLKGVSGDTGIQIHNTDPTSIAIDDSVASFVLTAAAEVAGLKIIWS